MNDKQDKTSHELPLPPLLAKNFIEWEGIEKIDFDSLGVVVACHLVVEHYLTRFLQIQSPKHFDWDAPRLTFTQKLAIVSGKDSPLHTLGLVEGIKRLNTIRNRMSHNIRTAVTETDVSVLKRILRSASKDKKAQLELNPIDTVRGFTWLICSYITGYCAGRVESARMQRNDD